MNQEGIMKYYRQHDVEYRGTIRRLNYVSTDACGAEVEKYANVYLPFGYDEDADQKYNVLYVMHGGGGNPDAWLDSSLIKNELDYAFSEKEAEPFIVVFPTYYKRGAKADQKPEEGFAYGNEQIRFFQKELREDLIPAVESAFRTFAEGIVTPEGLRASRKHRAFSGFSMGGGTTWYAFTDNLDVIADFAPLSGDCWAVEMRGGQTKPQETVQYMIGRIKEAGFTKADYRIFAATGTEDIAYPNLTPMVEEMKKFPEYFEFSDDLSTGNFHYLVEEGYEHSYPRVAEYLYNFLPYLF